MHIRSFHIHGFGLFSNVSLDSMPPGLSIFLGRNEAGKSTCLDFFRAMLTGYPDHRSKEGRNFAQSRSGQSGGTLTIDAGPQGLLCLTRRPGSGGGAISLTDSSGTALDLGVLDRLLAGVTREVYTSVFGFSLSELQTFKSLNSEGVRHALYGASFGMGLRPPGVVLKQIDERMEALFKPGGSRPLLNSAIKEWEELRREVQAAEEESRLYDSKKLELAEKDRNISDVRQKRSDMENERRQLEKRLGVWRQWDEWRKAAIRLERLEDVAETFPENGPARLTRATEIREEASRHCKSRREILERTNDAAAAMGIDHDLLEALPEIRALVERKLIYRNADAAIPTKEAARDRTRQELQRLLSILGPDWSCERIRNTDRSLFAREGLEQNATELGVAASSYTAATDSLQKANRAVESCDHALQIAQAKAEHLPMPVTAVDAEGRDEMRNILTRIEENRKRLPERVQALGAARAAFTRSCAPLRLRGNAPSEVLDKLSEVQDKAMELAAEVQKRIAAAEDAMRQMAQAQEAEEAAKLGIDRLITQQKAIQGPTRDALDAKAAALRNLRNLSSAQHVEMERKADMQSRLNAMWAPKPIKSLPLMLLGAAFSVAGGAILLASLKFGLTSFELTPQFSVPITTWLGYVSALAGVSLFLGGMPRSGPEAERFKREYEELTSRIQDTQKRIEDLDGQINAQSVAAGVDSTDAITLEATELLLERERELCVTEERLEEEMIALQGDLTIVREKTKRTDATRVEAESKVQQARRRWHEFLVGCNVDSIPAPEAVGAFFAKVESARLAAATVKNLEEEVAELGRQIKEKESSARAIPPVAEALPADGGDLSHVIEAVRRVLEACREADAASEERAKASAEVRNAEINAERAYMAQGEAMDAISEAENRLGAARESWRESLQTLGLGLDLSPGTVREAFECMERCLAAQAEDSRLAEELAHLTDDRDAVVKPLQALLERLKRDIKADALTKAPDWLATLDALHNDAIQMEKKAEDLARLNDTAQNQSDELKAAEDFMADSIKNERELLLQAGVENAEEFMRLAAVREERKEIIRRREDLEDALRLAAAEQPLEEFIESFSSFDREESEIRNTRITDELAALVETERRLAGEIAALDANISTLAGTDHFAHLRQQEASLLETIQCKAKEWSRLAVAKSLLVEAKKRFESERQPEVIRAASEIFSDITGKAWAAISASLEDSTLSVLSPSGEIIMPDVLSRGAQEQLYLSLRLAYIRNHAAHATALPVIMDDILVNFDPERARRTASALAPLVKGEHGGYPAHQVLFFTCHPHMAEMLKDTVAGSAIFMVEKGTIRQG